jgi:aminopeptidase N|uniref:Aminopeptidase n=1 Tax=Eutreptiella gymnastica TaxID=73025 RepID=A0A7S4GCC8_9EUGL|mmetsp:Transcript_71881/g.120533  ORF Transcript_71881/g.120533 Transcript_71881/m.120533 type:complete len:874 (+) Transcript_71881:25-2646(+)|eukprot:CAMPEP_0174283000 /NCGR_PEP_ID=MMETSP0809-20121228/3591_1 /TAXON_ID=73025 ORGANISM="Eutreptiella gymnastica-like, Strain CCMP1594" /NCGR_SAMPLE_ID=MMETSP0809 /ASSEMBLY_ACC=CAM_ASM_000658 /LENGTH=873 /DNA_ID=CAMNT_0015377585 /DNA_START=37 /DNA_END=2658 /DNA_ORIENTATION=-
MSYRVLLPDDVLPEHYDLSLEPNLQDFQFDGVVKIDCEVHVATDVITVHARELVIGEVTFDPADGKAMEADEISLKKKAQTATFKFLDVLPTGKGRLTIKFKGILNDQMAGFYRSEYVDSKGKKVHMATTQFEAIDARRCFPCWDEPARKATFTVQLTVPTQLTALSNMPESRMELLPDNKKRVSFLPTPKMSTYLLAFCIGEYESLQGSTKAGTLVRILCVPGKLDECEYALKIGIRALEFYNEFFGIPFPLPKMDMIAIPDFAAGAMENWGLVTYREVALLCNEKTVSTSMKQRICTVITHELAHQWFGNLVTMAWWDDLWLNEGFANWMQTFSADVLNPYWKIWEIYVGMEQQNALQLDGLRSSHPIQVPIANASEVEEVFDAISYCKGGSIVRMLFAVLGYEDFRKGLQMYFNRHAYGNTETEDLAKAWAEASGKPIGELVTSWTAKMGFPMLKVVKDPFAGGDGTMEIEQSWFLSDGSVEAGDEEVQWMIPLLMGSDVKAAELSDISFCKDKKMSMKLPTAGASWIKLNYGQHVPMRVCYPPEMMKRLSANVSQLPAEDRIGLLSDTYALCKAGHAEPSQLIDLLGGFSQESNDKVWSQLSGILQGLHKLFKATFSPEVASAFQAFAGKLVKPAADKIGWEKRADDTENDMKLRQIMIGLLSSFCACDPATWEAAKPRAEKLMKGSGDVPTDIRTAVFTMAMKNDPSSATYESLKAMHNGSTDGILKRDIYNCMAGASVPVQKDALQWCLSDDVKSQDLMWIPMGIVSSGKESAELTFNWVKEQFPRLEARLGATSMMLFTSIVRISGAGFVTKEKADEVRAFWETKSLYETVKKTVNQTCETIVINAKFVDRLLASELNTVEYWAKK